MRKIIFLFIMAAGVVCFAISGAKPEQLPETEITVYYVDSELNRLLPHKERVTDADTEHLASAAINLILDGRDGNAKIRRLIPNNDDYISVSVADNTAFVDIKSDMAADIPEGRDIEKLVIYQLVDTLTSLKGIRFVRFTVDGENKKDFMGYYDMRETYKFNYPE